MSLLFRQPIVLDTYRPRPSLQHRLESSYRTQLTTRRPRNRLTISFRGVIQISEDRRPVNYVFPYTGENNQESIHRAIIDYLSETRFTDIAFTINWDDFEIDVRTHDQPEPLLYANNRMRESKSFDVVNLFNNIINIESSENNCVPATLTKLYPKIAKTKKNPINALKEATTTEVMMFCKEYGIRAIAYNIHKEVIAENIPIKDTKSYASLAFLYYNNHMYLIQNKYLKEKPTPTNHQYEEFEVLQDHFRTLLRDKIVPANIRLFGTDVISFEHNDTIYFHNQDYHTTQSIAKCFMFSDKLPFQTTLTSIMTHLEDLYSSKKAMSFLPIHHVKPAFYYNTQHKQNRPTITIDKNKAYSYILKELPYLLSTDFRTYQHRITNQFITETALYIAKPHTPNILMPKQDIYTGSHIKYCQSKFPFTILEMLECKENPNHFTFLIDDLFNRIPHADAKKIVVRAIGNFQSEHNATNTNVTVVSKDDRNPSHFQIKYEDVYLELTPNTYVKNIYNRKPIAIQVKDRMNQTLYEKMVELSLTDQDIVQINTDSITFYEKPINFTPSTTMEGWKYSTYTEKQGSIYDNSEPFTTFLQTIPNNNTLILGHAGNGKSHHIQHSDLTDSIILSSKHSAIRQHREKGFNAQVIQKYEFNKSIPTESHIIVEECGILTRNHWDLLFKCILLKKKLTIYGDFEQLLPVEEIHTFNRPQWLNMVFNTQTTLNTNWRNHFTPEYYRSLYTSTDPNYLKEQLLLHSTKTPEEADVIIAYRNTIVDQYNDMMMNFHNSSDYPVICITNARRTQDIYNGFVFRSTEVEDPENRKVWRPAYCRTLYSMQGDQTTSFYIAPEDMNWFLNPRMAYTLISRLKTIQG